MDRRTFLAGALLAPADSIRTGLIGSGGRGQLLAAEFKEIGANVSAVCDVYRPHLEAGLKAASSNAVAFTDYRRLLDRKDIDAVIVATPDHWHARMVIDAVEAGKDVYVEKPLCHTAEEAPAIIRAVRRTRRICQVGTQRRSSPLFIDGLAIARSGRLGEVRLVTSTWLNHQAGLSSRPLAGELDWNAWLGPAPRRSLDPQRFFNWYYYFDYSGGLLIGQAAHIVDSIHWYMGSDAPAAVTCTGGRVNLSGAEVPETASMSLEYAENYLAVFTLGYKAMRYHTHNDQLVQYHGTKARMDVGREGYSVWPEQPTLQMKPEIVRDEPGTFVPATRAHIRNFLECIKTRNEPNAPVEAGASTAVALAMALDSLKNGRRVRKLID